MRRIFAIASILMVSVSCQKKMEGTGSLSFVFPAAPRTSGKLGTMSVDFAKVCYLANVTGGNITSRKQSACDIPFGIYTPFQLPETAASLMIPRGSGYTLEIYAYARSSATDACPNMRKDSFGGITLSKLHLVGKTEFKVDASEVTVKVDVTDPGQDVATQFSMPAICLASSTPATGGPVLVSPGGLRLSRAVDGTDAKKHISTTNGYGLVLSKDGSR